MGEHVSAPFKLNDEGKVFVGSVKKRFPDMYSAYNVLISQGALSLAQVVG